MENKKYSYLGQKAGLETFYRPVKTINTFNGLIAKGGLWTAYGCIRNDCIESEKYVAVKKYTNDRLTAGNLLQLEEDLNSFDKGLY